MKKRNCICRATSFAIAVVMAFITLTGCASGAKDRSGGNKKSAVTSITTKDIADSISEAIREETESQDSLMNISFDPDDYAGDLDAFVYGLIVTEYELCYNVFNAAIELPDGETVYGIGYTDYADRYDSDDGKIFFPAGFIALIGEPEIPADAAENGLEVIDLECDTYEYGFVLAYDTDAFTEHCVIWEQYLQYGVDDTGTITYKAEPYAEGVYDESLGTLYSYDDQKYILNFEQGEYTPLTGVSLSEQIDFADLEAEVNRIIDEQNKNFSKAEIETIVAEAPEYLEAAMLSLQTETFMGYDTKELVEMAKGLDPMECIRFTPEGTVVVDAANDIPKSPDALTKWLVGISCGILVVGSIALDVFVPVLAPLSGAISGAAVEVFVQVVIENQNTDNVNWTKVAVASVSGAVLAWACPLASQAATQRAAGAIGKKTIEICGKEIATESLAKLAGYGTLAFSNALVSGVTNASFAAIDGKTSKETFDAFISGAAIGGACTSGAAALGEIGQKAAEAINRAHPNNWLNKAATSVSKFIGKHQVHLKNQKLENILAPKSVYEAAKEATSELPNAPIKNKALGLKREQKVCKKLQKQYPAKDGYKVLSEKPLCDKNGNIVVDPDTGETRRVDFIVVNNDNKIVDSVEVTSKTANKTAQIAKENRIREKGGNYIKKSNGDIVEIPSDILTRIERVA